MFSWQDFTYAVMTDIAAAQYGSEPEVLDHLKSARNNLQSAIELLEDDAKEARDGSISKSESESIS